AAPQVYFVGDVDGNAPQRRFQFGQPVGNAAGGAGARIRGIQGYVGEFVRAGDAEQGAAAVVTRQRGGEVLVGGEGGLDVAAEFLVAEQGPPGVGNGRGGGGRVAPRGRCGCVGTLVVRPDHAAGQAGHRESQGRGAARTHGRISTTVERPGVSRSRYR